jgi:UDP-glucose 4-epimerase
MGSSRWRVTGGAGYIGAHVVRALLASGREVFVIDDLSTGVASRLPDGVEQLTGSVTDSAFLTSAVRPIEPTGVVHLAGKKSPTDSIADPLLFARENVGGVISLLEAVRRTGVTRVVLSSSCSVYGTPITDQAVEDAPKLPESPYGDSKLYGERLLSAAAAAYGLGVISLRYFNVVGAADPVLADTGYHNLIPQVFEAIRHGRAPRIFGDDYPTADGTGVRDYVGVEDVANAHVRSAEALEQQNTVATFNVGVGAGSSVLQVLEAIRLVSGHSFEAEILPRRPGTRRGLSVGSTSSPRSWVGRPAVGLWTWSARRGGRTTIVKPCKSTDSRYHRW